MKVKEIKMREDAQMTQPATVTKFIPGQELAVSNPQTGTTVTTDLRKNPAALSIDPATGKPLVDPTPTAGTAAANTNPATQLRPGASAELAVGETHDEYDFDSDDTTAKQVRDMASWLENRWGSYEDWSQEELESIADELQISVEEVADALGLALDETHGPIGGDPTDDFINDIEDKDFRESTDLSRLKKLSGL